MWASAEIKQTDRVRIGGYVMGLCAGGFMLVTNYLENLICADVDWTKGTVEDIIICVGSRSECLRWSIRFMPWCGFNQGSVCESQSGCVNCGRQNIDSEHLWRCDTVCVKRYTSKKRQHLRSATFCQMHWCSLHSFDSILTNIWMCLSFKLLIKRLCLAEHTCFTLASLCSQFNISRFVC